MKTFNPLRFACTIAVAILVAFSSCSKPPLAEENPSTTQPKETPAANPVIAQEPGTDVMYVALELASYEVEVGEFPVVQITVRAPHEKAARIIKFDFANTYGKLGVVLYGPDGKRIPDGRPVVQSLISRLDEAHELIIKPGEVATGKFTSYVAPRVAGYHFLQVQYSPTWAPVHYMDAKFRINVIPKKIDAQESERAIEK